MWFVELIIFFNRFIEYNKKIEPMITWSPWKPVAMKKLDPKEVSEIVKGAETYSNPWKAEKIAPNKTVKLKDKMEILNSPFNNEWCLHVTDTPEDNKRIVFKSGILIGLKGRIPTGGQDCPNSTVGEILLCKKAQKKDTKNKISDKINKIIPIFNPFITELECHPWIEDSRWISSHHKKASVIVKMKIIKKETFKFLLIKINPEKTNARALLEARIGQGLTSTKWKGLNLVIILFYFCHVKSN